MQVFGEQETAFIKTKNLEFREQKLKQIINQHMFANFFGKKRQDLLKRKYLELREHELKNNYSTHYLKVKFV